MAPARAARHGQRRQRVRPRHHHARAPGDPGAPSASPRTTSGRCSPRSGSGTLPALATRHARRSVGTSLAPARDHRRLHRLHGADRRRSVAAAFVAIQLVARVFIAAEDMLGIVVVAEEIAAARRGFALGVLAALGGIGHGLAAVSYAIVGSGPYGWRLLYLAGALPARRGRVAPPEPGRDATLRRPPSAPRRGRDARRGLPLVALARAHPGRLAALAGMVLPIYFVTALRPSRFQSKFLQEAHGYTPAAVAFLYFVGGLVRRRDPAHRRSRERRGRTASPPRSS